MLEVARALQVVDPSSVQNSAFRKMLRGLVYIEVSLKTFLRDTFPLSA